MKHIAQALALTVILVIVALVVMSVSGRNAREKEVQESLQAAVDEAVNDISTSRSYTMDSIEQLEWDFTELLCNQMNVNGDTKTDESGNVVSVTDKGDQNLQLQVSFSNTDKDEGYLGILVTETFTYPLGTTGEVSATAVLSFDEEGETEYFTVEYRIDWDDVKYVDSNELYDTYTLSKYSTISTPSTNPTYTGRRKSDFKGWKLIQSDISNDARLNQVYTNSQIASLELNTNLIFEAVFKDN